VKLVVGDWWSVSQAIDNVFKKQFRSHLSQQLTDRLPKPQITHPKPQQ
jgi:hypothetical protein